ncbi:hypothetical protein D6851_05895 [Altericroceibacterium spongiae]|uniref:Uncharacterized protein n=1 Tax=Altericroceibacterium spongiae TaxID=2320269 RepID=A0A420EPY1_9SPHN|nr:helicase RepA family protein [Altericroceibacterium spongiae]RKF22728.1 hypothetical protein D6851_05895 [Altericroceibacterium spongiae]
MNIDAKIEADAAAYEVQWPAVDPVGTEGEAGHVKIAPTPWQRSLPPPRQWLYGYHLSRKVLTGTISPGGIGKSSLVMVDALAMATGRQLLHNRVHIRGGLRVWYWCGEDTTEELDRRLEAACIHHLIFDEQIGGRLFVDSGRNQPIKIATAEGTTVTVAKPVVDELVAQMRERRIDVLIVDPFVTCHAVNENDNGAINAVIDAWRDVADKANAAIELVHHTNKAANANDPNINDGRGASAFRDGIRAGRVLAPLNPQRGQEEWGLEPKEVVRIFQSLDGAKANMSPRGGLGTWYRMASVNLDNGTPEYPWGDEIGVVEKWSPPDAFEGVKLDDLAMVQAAIAKRATLPAANPANKDWLGYLVAEALGLDIGAPGSTKADRDAQQNMARGRVTSLIRTWTANKALERITSHSSRDGREYPAFKVGKPAHEPQSPHSTAE